MENWLTHVSRINGVLANLLPAGFPIAPNTPPAGFTAGFNLDLWEVQNVIRRQFRI
ncbi:hypothetical protein C1646_773270 [Rhizophagus diaphanus]|nr:hypothetical protein C1646_773270 [Rhizophagus diaphanus] [Rhizophagus sp. MUCL 43196]